MREDEKNYFARHWMARCHREFALSHFRQFRYADALAEYRKEQEIRTRLVADSPTPEHREALGTAIRGAGSCLKELERHAESEKEYVTALPIFRALIAEFPKNLNYQWNLANTLSYLAAGLITQQRFAEAEKPAAEADQLFAELDKVVSDAFGLRKMDAQNTGFLAAARAHAGDHASAGQLLGKMMALDPNTAGHYYAAAWVLNYCVLAAERYAKLTDQQRKDLVHQYTDRLPAAGRRTRPGRHGS